MMVPLFTKVLYMVYRSNAVINLKPMSQKQYPILPLMMTTMYIRKVATTELSPSMVTTMLTAASMAREKTNKSSNKASENDRPGRQLMF
eukprot:scaffold297392_cov18-Prasinocladus_malaysianus.AAC.1